MIGNILRTLISEYWAAIASVGVLWGLLYLILYKLLQLKEAWWKGFEFIWIIIGFVSVLTLVSTNKINYLHYERQNLESQINLDRELLLQTLKGSWLCFKFERSENSPHNFDEIVVEQQTLCNWSKKLISFIETPEDSLVVDIDKLPLLYFNDIYIKNDYLELIQRTTSLNFRLQQKKDMIEQIRESNWQDVYQTLGVLLLIIAFSFRLAIASRNFSISRMNKQ